MADDLNGTAPETGAADTAVSDAQPEPAAPQTAEQAIDSVFDGLDFGDDDDLWSDTSAPDARAEQPRDAQGKFTSNKPEGEAPEETSEEAEQAEAGQPEEPEQSEPEQQTDPVSAAPSGINQEAWAKAPPELRADVERRFGEMESGLRQYQEFMAPLKPHIEKAREGGHEFGEVVEGWSRYEGWMRNDPVQGFQYMAQALGIDQERFALELLERVDRGQTGAQLQQQQARPAPEVAAIQGELQQLRGMLQAQQQQTERAQVQAQIDAFKASAPRFDELQETVAQFLQSPMVPADAPIGERLRTAYEFAERLKPAPVTAEPVVQPRPQPQAQTPRGANRSISGAPGGGVSPAQAPRDHTLSAAVDAAFDSAGI